MITPRSRKFFRFVAPLLAILAMAANLPAQSTRSNTSSRSSSSNRNSTRTSSSSRGTSSVGTSSSSGTRQYRSNTLLGDAVIQVDPETRSVVIVADEETHNELAKVIDNLDHPKPQVLIKVVFLEVTLDKNLDVGIEGSYTFKVGHGIPVSGTGSSTSAALSSGSATLGSLFGLAEQTNGSFVRLTTDDWQATLHALDKHGNLHILSRPSIMARNNQEAVIVVGQEVPFVTNSQISTTGAVNNTIQYQDVGIILRVTPFITSNKTVEMIVAPEISSISNQTIAISDTVKAPVINKRSAETVVVTPNGTTVVIGGMMQKRDTTDIEKIPILGDIPILGWPFRHTVKSEQKSELLIFLTPYIVESTEKLKELTLGEANRAELTREGFSPEDIHQNLDTLELLPLPQPDLKEPVEPKVKPAPPKKG